MTDVLAGAGLEPASSEPADQQVVVEPAEPATPAEPVEPAVEPTDDEIVVPEGAENPDAVRNAIAAERKAAKDANARARALEAQLREQQEQARPLEDRLADAESRAADATLAARRIEIGVSKGLSLGLAKRVSGTTDEEIAADAAALAAEMGTTTATSPVIPGATADGGFQTPPPAAKADPMKDHNNFLAGILRPGS